MMVSVEEEREEVKLPRLMAISFALSKGPFKRAVKARLHLVSTL